MQAPIRIGLVGAGRILPAHLRGYHLLRQAGVDSFRITAITSHTRRDAESRIVYDDAEALIGAIGLEEAAPKRPARRRRSSRVAV